MILLENCNFRKLNRKNHSVTVAHPCTYVCTPSLTYRICTVSSYKQYAVCSACVRANNNTWVSRICWEFSSPSQPYPPMIASWSNSTLCSPWSPWWCASRGTNMPSLTRSLLLCFSCLCEFATAPCVGIGPTVATMARAQSSMDQFDRFLGIFFSFDFFVYMAQMSNKCNDFHACDLTCFPFARQAHTDEVWDPRCLALHTRTQTGTRTHAGTNTHTRPGTPLVVVALEILLAGGSQHVIAENREILWTLLNSVNGFA